MIEKVKNNKLRVWSFGFETIREHEEELKGGLKRRFVDEMNLAEVSIIDDRKNSWYVETYIEKRANKNYKIEYRGENCTPKIIDNIEKKSKIDYSIYERMVVQTMSHIKFSQK